jgi:methionine biosynthesis protein MetW
MSEPVTGLTTGSVGAHRYEGLDTSPYEVPAIIASFIPRGSRVLEIGCGGGRLSNFIQETRDADIIGIEPNEERAAASLAKGVKTICGIYTERVVDEFGKFDAIILADVLEHLVDPGAFLPQLRNALRPNGIIIASIPNVAHWTVRLSLLLGRFNYEESGIMDATHLRWFTRASAWRLFVSAGYQIVAFSATAGAWMDVYQLRRGSRALRTIVVTLAKWWPGLFGCQHIIVAN